MTPWEGFIWFAATAIAAGLGLPRWAALFALITCLLFIEARIVAWGRRCL